LAAAASVGLLFAEHANATLLTGSVDTIYADNFAAPAVNVNAATTDPNSIVGNTPATETGLDGGSATSPYLGIATFATGAVTPDAAWNYSGANSATLNGQTANIATTGSLTGEDGNSISNLTLPLVPVIAGVGFEEYDLELTMTNPAASGGHGLEMAYLFNNGNGHNTAAQAISNNDPVGLILDRDANASTTPGSGYFDIFEATGTGSDHNFAPTASALTGGTAGTTVTVDILYTALTTTSGSMSWYVNGVLANPTPVVITGLTNGISDIQFGDNRSTGVTFTNFSLTATDVPEPASAGLMLMSLPMLLRRGRQKKE
jgi:hypothetical protein